MLQKYKQMIDGVCTMEALDAGKCTLEKGFQISEPQQELTESVKPFLLDLYLVSDKHNFPSICFLITIALALVNRKYLY